MNVTPLPVFVTPMVSSLTLFLLFLYLTINYKERFLGLWTAAWGVWFVRLGFSAIEQDNFYGSSTVYIHSFLVLVYTTLVLLGAADLSKQSVLKYWIPLGVAALLFRYFGPAEGLWSPALIVFTFVIGLGWTWAGILFERADQRYGTERWLPTVALILMGLHQAAVPLAVRFPVYSDWSSNITLALQIAIAIGVVLVFDRRTRLQLDETHEALENSLTKMLSGYIPICANCKSIRDEEQQWRRLESYISQQTDAKFSHGICPSCKDELYPELVDKADKA